MEPREDGGWKEEGHHYGCQPPDGASSPTFTNDFQTTEITSPSEKWLLWRIDSEALYYAEFLVLPKPALSRRHPPILQIFPILEMATVDITGVQCHRLHPSVKPFPSGEFISEVWSSAGILGDLQALFGG